MRADRLEELRQELEQSHAAYWNISIEELLDLVDHYVPPQRCGRFVGAINEHDGEREPITAECYLPKDHASPCIGYTELHPAGKLFLVTDEIAKQIIFLLDLAV